MRQAWSRWRWWRRRIDVAIASNTLYLAPPLTIVIGWAALDEAATLLTLLGGLVVLSEGRHHSPRPPPAGRRRDPTERRRQR